MYEITRFLSQVHLEHFVDFCSSAIIVINFVAIIYPTTRKKIIQFFTDKKHIRNIEKDKKELNLRLSNVEKELTQSKLATITILRDRLYSACTKALKKGEISVMGLDNIIHLYETYHEMGGNGTGTDLVKKVKKLPIITEDWNE